VAAQVVNSQRRTACRAFAICGTVGAFVKGMDHTTSSRHSATAARNSKSPDALRPLLADLFVFYVKTRNLHWYLSRADLAGCGRLLEEQAAEIRTLTQLLADRARAAGCDPYRQTAWIVDSDRLRNIDYTEFERQDSLNALRSGNRRLAQLLRFAHVVVAAEHDATAAKLIEGWIEETECRDWLLLQTALQNSCRNLAPLSEMRQAS
jgi:starvation-inducible DNA-binding protein